MEKILIIAEAGVNHNGDIVLAKKLIDVASEIKADYIKFQLYNTESLVTKNAKKAEYQALGDNAYESQFEMLKRLQISKKDYLQLVDYSKLKNIKIFATAFDLESIDFLESIGQDLYKVPSGEINNWPYLHKIGKINKPIILSTGMSTMLEISDAIKALTEAGAKRSKITLLHCTSEYPAPIDEINLRAMKTISESFNLKVGYSDHTRGIHVAIASAALGAKIIEKHITLNKNLPGPDHSSSTEPEQFKEMIQAVHDIEIALGKSSKEPTKSELNNMINVRKSICAKKKIKKNEVFSEENLTVKRPGNGISPMKWKDILGKKACRIFYQDELIEL